MLDLIKAYENYLSKVKQASANTVASYMRDIRQFASYCDTQKLRAVSSVKPPLINDYILYLQNAGKSTATLTRIIASLRCYFAFLNSIVGCEYPFTFATASSAVY